MRPLGILLPMLAMATATWMTGCAMKPPAAETPAEAAGAEAPEDAGGDAGEVGSGKQVKTADGLSADSAADDEADEESKPTTARRGFSSVVEALDAFEEDEIRLSRLLGDGDATALDTNACGSICDALASMRRASDAICDLAGEDDQRCERARDKLAGNERRIEGRGCRCAP